MIIISEYHHTSGLSQVAFVHLWFILVGIIICCHVSTPTVNCSNCPTITSTIWILPLVKEQQMHYDCFNVFICCIYLIQSTPSVPNKMFGHKKSITFLGNDLHTWSQGLRWAARRLQRCSQLLTHTEQSLNECILQIASCQQYSSNTSGGKSRHVCCSAQSVLTHRHCWHHIYKHHHDAEHHLTACGVCCVQPDVWVIKSGLLFRVAAI